MILLDCDRNSTNNYIFPSPVQQIVRNQSISRTTVFYKPLFELSVMRGNFFSLGRIRWHSLFTRWHSRGFLPNVRGRINKTYLFGFLDFSTLWKHFQCCFKCQRCKFFACMYYIIRFSFGVNTQFLLSFVDSVELVLIFKFSFPFSAILCGCRL